MMDKEQKTNINHVSISVAHLQRALEYYQKNFNCDLEHQDEFQVVLQFENIKLVLVLISEEPAHIAYTDDAVEDGKVNYDGSYSTYTHDGFGNIVEHIKEIK